ncbi:MAG TPA: glycosyltransferase family 4 protein [Solirubrobacterales bacterium]|nr:glycosyltransferase family 4 protein [Solirubrobacterales bacterium]
MIITFPVLASTRPMGGAIAIYEIANAMCRRGHSVHVMHVGVNGPIWSLDDLPWMSFEDGIQHIYPGGDAPADAVIPQVRRDERAPIDGVEGYRLAWFADDLPPSDFIAAYDDQLPPRHGLPFIFVQGFFPHAPGLGDALFRIPCPKVCVSRWLIDAGRQRGVPEEQLVLVPNGVRHEKYRLLSPIEDRPPLISTAYHNHPQKGPAESLAVFAEVKRRVPEVDGIVFTQLPPVHETAPWMTVVTDPPQEFIVNEIYNRSRIYLCASRYEGFGFPCVEAMACGAALVTTSNGGSGDYAIHEETALVCEPDDVAGMAGQVERLLHDDELRIRLAKQGMEYVRRMFDWDASAERLETFLDEYAGAPDRYLRPAPSSTAGP